MSTEDEIAFHARCCVRQQRSRTQALAQLRETWGHRPDIERIYDAAVLDVTAEQ